MRKFSLYLLESNLIHRAEKVITGANCHSIRQVMAAYMASKELMEMNPKNEMAKRIFKDSEKKLNKIIFDAEQKSPEYRKQIEKAKFL